MTLNILEALAPIIFNIDSRKLLHVYWLKKDIENILRIAKANANDSLTEAAQLQYH